MMNAEPAAVKVTKYTVTRGTSTRKGRSNTKSHVWFMVADGPYERKGHKMHRVPFVKLHKVGTVAPGRYYPKTGVAMTNKYGRHVTFVTLFFLFLSGGFLWLGAKYRKSL